jgi:hypothetical protein
MVHGNCKENTQAIHTKTDPEEDPTRRRKKSFKLNLGRKCPGRKRIFKPPDSVHFGFAADRRPPRIRIMLLENRLGSRIR